MAVDSQSTRKADGLPVVYGARVVQLGVNPPASIADAVNTTGVTPVWSRTSAGVYVLTFTGLGFDLTPNNVLILITMNNSAGTTVRCWGNWTGIDNITIYSYDAAQLPVDLFGNISLKIEMYP